MRYISIVLILSDSNYMCAVYIYNYFLFILKIDNLYIYTYIGSHE